MFAVIACVLFVIGWLGPAANQWDLLFAGLAFLALSHVFDPFLIGWARTGRRRV